MNKSLAEYVAALDEMMENGSDHSRAVMVMSLAQAREMGLKENSGLPGDTLIRFTPVDGGGYEAEVIDD